VAVIDWPLADPSIVPIWVLGPVDEFTLLNTLNVTVDDAVVEIEKDIVLKPFTVGQLPVGSVVMLGVDGIVGIMVSAFSTEHCLAVPLGAVQVHS
jgi:hypothetical protein